jgi:hypothetical protein
MALQTMTPKGYAKAIGIGIATAAILSLVMVPAFKTGISPLPKPLGLAFAQVLLGDVPLPVGLLFHVAYVTFWSVVYLAFFGRRTFLNALWLALGLWLGVLVIFFPIVGWGFFGLAVSPKLIVASLVPHVLFAAVLWALSSWAFPASAQSHRESA